MVTKAVGMDHTRILFDIIRAEITDNYKVWETPKRCNRVLFCDSLISLRAVQLERLFNECIDDQIQETANGARNIRVIWHTEPRKFYASWAHLSTRLRDKGLTSSPS